MIRFPALVALLALSFSSLALASDDFSFHEFVQADPLPMSMIADPIDGSEIELDRISHGVVIEAETSGLTPTTHIRFGPLSSTIPQPARINATSMTWGSTASPHSGPGWG